MPPHPLTNFEMKKYYQNQPRFNGVYSRDNLTEIKDEADEIDLDEYSDIGSHWVALHLNNTDVTYFDFLVQNIFQRRLEHLSVIKTIKQIFLEYKHMVQ